MTQAQTFPRQGLLVREQDTQSRVSFPSRITSRRLAAGATAKCRTSVAFLIRRMMRQYSAIPTPKIQIVPAPEPVQISLDPRRNDSVRAQPALMCGSGSYRLPLV